MRARSNIRVNYKTSYMDIKRVAAKIGAESEHLVTQAGWLASGPNSILDVPWVKLTSCAGILCAIVTLGSSRSYPGWRSPGLVDK